MEREPVGLKNRFAQQFAAAEISLFVSRIAGVSQGFHFHRKRLVAHSCDRKSSEKTLKRGVNGRGAGSTLPVHQRNCRARTLEAHPLRRFVFIGKKRVRGRRLTGVSRRLSCF